MLATVAACDRLGLGGDKSPVAPTGPPSAGSTITYTAIGASDADGVGSSAPCLPFTDCPDGMGYVPVTIRQLRSQGFTVTFRNLGLPTAVISRGFQTLGQQNGRTIEANFIEQEMPFVLPGSTLVTIFAGVNEINTITSALGAGAGGSDPNGYIDTQVKAFGADYATLLGGVRVVAGTARYVVLNVPNAAGMPFLAGASLAPAPGSAARGRRHDEDRRQSARLVDDRGRRSDVRRAQLHRVELLIGRAATRTTPGTRSSPARSLRATTSASYPAPQSSCPGMTIVP